MGRSEYFKMEKMAGFRVSVIVGDTMPEEICPVVGRQIMTVIYCLCKK